MSVDTVRNRLSVAAPVSLLYAILAMAVVSVLPARFAFVGALLLIAGPPAGAVRLLDGSTPRMKVLGGVLALLVAVAVIAGIVLGLLPVFEVPGVGISGTGVYVMVYLPVLLLAVASAILRGRDDRHDALLAVRWGAALVLLLFGERLVGSLTSLAGADAIAGSLAFLGAPTVGLATFSGIAVAAGLRSAGARPAVSQEFRTRGVRG
jgi:hypothetical protein